MTFAVSDLEEKVQDTCRDQLGRSAIGFTVASPQTAIFNRNDILIGRELRWTACHSAQWECLRHTDGNLIAGRKRRLGNRPRKLPVMSQTFKFRYPIFLCLILPDDASNGR
jgi:hypothetical protein